MTKPKALLLAGFTLWPIVYMFLFMAFMFSQVFIGMDNPTQGDGMPLAFKIIFPLHFLTMLEIFVLIAVYIWHIFKTDVIAQDKKALWAVVIFLGNMVAMPVYWWLYIWKQAGESGANRT